MTQMLEIKVVPLLACGGIGHGPNGVFMLVADDLTRHEAAKTLWHETVHWLRSANTNAVHCESEIEEIAEKLAAACPEIVAWCGLDAMFPQGHG